MSGDEFEHQVRPGRDGRHRARSRVGSEHLLEGIRIVLDPGDDLAAVAAGGARANVGGFQHHHLPAGLRQVQGGRQAGVAGADDGGLGAPRAGERLTGGAGRRRHGPQRLQRHDGHREYR